MLVSSASFVNERKTATPAGAQSRFFAGIGKGNQCGMHRAFMTLAIRHCVSNRKPTCGVLKKQAENCATKKPACQPAFDWNK
jgi:hypothetical protein